MGKKSLSQFFFELPKIFAVAAVYFAAAKFGLLFATANPSSTTIWPPTGIAIACVILFGYRVWPGIFLGAFFANLTTAGTIITSVGIAGGNTLEAIVAGYLVITYSHGRRVFDLARDAFGFIFFAGVLATLVSATIGVTTLFLGGFVPPSALGATWIVWWLGDMGGALVIAPLIIIFGTIEWRRWSVKEVFEFTGMIALLAAVSGIVFGIVPMHSEIYHFAFLPIPVILWIAFRFEQGGTGLGIFILAIISAWSTLHRIGPFSGLPYNDSLLILQIYVSIIASTKLLVTSALAERRRARDLLAAQERRFRKLIEKHSDGVALLDDQGIMFYISPSLENILGYRPEELMGSRETDLVHSDDATARQETLGMPELAPGTVSRAQFRIRKKDGSWLWVESTRTNLINDPDVHGILINYRDISKEKEIEKLRTDLLSLASHQLRTPLSGTKWLIDTLLMGTLGPVNTRQEEYLRDIYRSNERMIALVFDMLNALRVESGSFPLSLETVDISAFCADLSAVMESAAKKRNITLTCLANHIPSSIKTDPFIIKQILQIFLSNSFEYSPDNTEVTLGIEGREKSIIFSVRDSGIGIPREEYPRIFERFYRGSNAKIVKPDGTGLGLYVSRILAQRLGARMWFESELDKGSVFYLEIPL